MPRRVVLLMVVLGTIGFAALEVMKWQFRLGRYAENPQRVRLGFSSRAIVGGGQAVVGWTSYGKDDATFEIRCNDIEEQVILKVGESSDELCGIWVRWIETTLDFSSNQPRVVLLVSWSE